MNPEKVAEYQAKIRKLYHAYRERMAGELAALRELAMRLEGTERDRELLITLQQQLHTLAGSAGTFGQTALSEQARSLELIIISWLNRPSLALNTEERHHLATKITALPATLTDVAPSP